jgi:uncharacterized protein (TIGR00297 family)
VQAADAGDGSDSCAHRAVAPRRRAIGAGRLTERVLAGFAFALVVALLARRLGALTISGVVAATLLGTLAVAAGWPWGILLVTYFVSAAALSNIGAARKKRRTWTMVEKGGARDAVQVLANGGVFGAAVLMSALFPHAGLLPAIAIGAIAASAADTWATEIGTLWGGPPRSVRTWRPVPVGTSGGITGVGTAAMVAGALFMALVVHLLEWRQGFVAGALIGGIAGAVMDTALGATLQERRRCMGCGEHTERRIHTCGSRTRRDGGVNGLGNDAVNFVAALMGGVIALGVADVIRS